MSLSSIRMVRNANISKQKTNKWEVLIEQVKAVLDEKQKETLRWINGLGFNNRPAAISRRGLRDGYVEEPMN